MTTVTFANGRILELSTVEERMLTAILARRKGGTHWEGCENVHQECAAERIAQLEIALVRGQVANVKLRQKVQRLTWILRAIDVRLHAEMNQLEFTPTGGLRVPRSFVISGRTLRQMCNCAVSGTAERPPDPPQAECLTTE